MPLQFVLAPRKGGRPESRNDMVASTSSGASAFCGEVTVRGFEPVWPSTAALAWKPDDPLCRKNPSRNRMPSLERPFLAKVPDKPPPPGLRVGGPTPPRGALADPQAHPTHRAGDSWPTLRPQRGAWAIPIRRDSDLRQLETSHSGRARQSALFVRRPRSPSSIAASRRRASPCWAWCPTTWTCWRPPARRASSQTWSASSLGASACLGASRSVGEGTRGRFCGSCSSRRSTGWRGGSAESGKPQRAVHGEATHAHVASSSEHTAILAPTDRESLASSRPAVSHEFGTPMGHRVDVGRAGMCARERHASGVMQLFSRGGCGSLCMQRFSRSFGRGRYPNPPASGDVRLPGLVCAVAVHGGGGRPWW